MIVENQLGYVRFQTLIRRLLFIIGFWNTKNSSPLFRSLLLVHLSFFILPLIGVVNFFKTHISNIFLATKGLSVLVGYSTVIMKMICFMVNRKDLNELHATLEPYIDGLGEKSGVSKDLFKGVSIFRGLCAGLTGCVTASSTMYAIIPILTIISQYRHQIRPLKFLHLYPVIYPWERSPSGLTFYCQILNEYLTTFSIITVTASVDCLFVYYIFQMVGMIRDISYNISSLTDENCEATVRQCVRQYEVLLECRKKVDKVFGPIILWSMGTNAIVLCGLIFQLSHAKTIPFLTMVLCAAYVSSKVTQIFMFAWAASKFTTESNKLIDTIYAANWVGNKRVSTSIIIMLSQRPLVVTACSYSTISIEMFSAVMNTTISYFLLLKNFDPDA
ncbi:odorant receptor 13a-like [Microplitis demolitor]|uniref:odorant receptor 13a-like n=1 Tax=Microplitis demolitor TaxID=69319 RepID=UPI00235B5B98|nr:odorant receptor 13a-like [Microplitis demolitor]